MQQVTLCEKGPRARRGSVGAMVGAAIGACLGYAAGESVGVAPLMILGGIIGGSVGRESGAYSFDGKPLREPVDVCRKAWQVTERLVFEMDPACRLKVVRCRKIFNAFLLCVLCYAVLLGALEYGRAAIYGEYLRFCAPLVNFMSDFFPRAVAVRDALQEHGYAARAEFAEHMIVMTRLFLLPWAVVMVVMLVHAYRGCRPAQFRSTRYAYYSYYVLLCVGFVVVMAVAMAVETGFLTLLNFSSAAYAMGKLGQYHETNVAVVVEVAAASVYAEIICALQKPVMLARGARPIYTR